MSFLRLQQSSGFYLLTDYGFAHRAPLMDHMLEVECQLVTQGTNGISRPRIRVPLTDFAMYPTGSTFGTLKGKRAKHPGRRTVRRSLDILQTNELWHLDRTLDFIQPKLKGRFKVDLPRPHPVYFIEQDSGPQFGIVQSEPLRFLSSGVSLLLETIASATTIRPTSEQLFMDARESGQDGRQLILTPLRQFQNMTATLQMALMFSDPDLLRYFSYAYINLRRRIAANLDGLLSHSPYPRAFDFSVETEILTGFVHDGSRQTVEVCDRIVADHREPNFDELIIRVRRSAVDEKLAQLETMDGPSDDPTEIDRSVFTDHSDVKKYPQPGRRTFRIASLGSTFTQRFPGFGRIPVRMDYVHETNASHHPMPRYRFREVDAGVGSIGQPTTAGSVPRLVSGDIPDREMVDFEPPLIDANFMPLVVEHQIRPIGTPIADLPLLMRNFVTASYYLDDERAHDILPEFACSPNETILWQLPAEWGGFALMDKHGRHRYIAVTPLRFDEGLVWAIEILRRNPSREKLAIGLCAPRVFDDSISFLSRLMHAVCDRIGKRRDDEPTGTWPRAIYRDVRIDSLVHSPARLLARNLAAVVQARAHALVAPLLDI